VKREVIAADGVPIRYVETFAADVVAVARDANLSRAIVVGHSMGGQVAVDAAWRLSGVATIAGLRADFPTAAAAFMRQHLFAPSTPVAIVQRVVADATRADAGAAVDALDSLWRYDGTRALEALDIPVRAINAHLAPTDVAGNRRHARDDEAVVLRGMGHYPMLETPDAFNARLGEAIAALARR
jgi:pimeloyl-ACP methyl ester carboxylesterase